MTETIPMIPPPEQSFWDDLDQGETLPLLAQGLSMRPFYQSDTWFLVHKEPVTALRRGDLVVMTHESAVVIHRLRHSPTPNSQIWTTRGDAYKADDHPWSAADYRAKVVGVMREQDKATWRSHAWTHHLTCMSFRFAQPLMDITLYSVRRIKRILR